VHFHEGVRYRSPKENDDSIRPVFDRTFLFAWNKEAFNCVESGHAKGKLSSAWFEVAFVGNSQHSFAQAR